MPILRQYFTPFITPNPAQLLPKLASVRPGQQPNQQQSQFAQYTQPQVEPTQPQFEQTPFNTLDRLREQFKAISDTRGEQFKPTPMANNTMAATATNPIANFSTTSAARPSFQEYFNQLQSTTRYGDEAASAAQARQVFQQQQQLASSNSPTGAQPESFSSNADNFTPSGNSIVDIAKTTLGLPYVWGGTTMKGFDCSGLVYYVLNRAGIKVPRLRASEYGRMGQRVSLAQARPGDLVYFDNPGSTDHIGIYVGGGKFINAPTFGSPVQINNVGNYTSIRRLG